MRTAFRIVCLILGLAATPTLPAESLADEDADDLARRIESLKLQSVNLARDLWLLEQDLGTDEGRLVVFVSIDPRLKDRPQEIELMVGDQSVARHQYNAAESEALGKGGSHRLYAGALEPGRHVLEARLRAHGDDGTNHRSAKLSFRNGDAPKNIELRLQPGEAGLPELVIREWD